MNAAIHDPNKATAVMTQPTAQVGGMLSVSAQREIAEVQAAIIMARQFPRDMRTVFDRVTMACTRPELAEGALYSYARGGTEITGPSIRLAECIAQNYQNLQFGVRELEQRRDESTVEAFAIDLETNVRQVKIFQVPHVRYTKSGGRQNLSGDPRDVYELVANQGARRLRACILGIVPGDLVEAAVQQVELTLKQKGEVTPERLESLLKKFADYKVTQAMIEKRIQRRLDAMTPSLMVQLGKIYNSLKDGMSKAGDWFEVEAPVEEHATGAEAAKAALRKRSEQKPVEEAPPPPPEGELDLGEVE